MHIGKKEAMHATTHRESPLYITSVGITSLGMPYTITVRICIILAFTLHLQAKIRENLSDVVKYEVDRSTHDVKLRDFHEWMKAVKKDTLHHVNYCMLIKVAYETIS